MDLRAHGNSSMEWMMREHLKTPTPPTIVFSGDSSVFKKGIEMGKYVSGQIPGSKFVPFEKSGHLPFYEESDKFNSSLMEFLKEF